MSIDLSKHTLVNLSIADAKAKYRGMNVIHLIPLESGSQDRVYVDTNLVKVEDIKEENE